jgi:hypothetical protein
MQLQRSLRPSVQVANPLHQLQQIHLTKTHGQQHLLQHQQVVDGEHLLPTNHRSKPTDNPFLVRKN